MKISEKINTGKWSWVSAIVFVFLIAFVAGCANANEDEAALQNIAGAEADRGAEDEALHCCHTEDSAFANFQDFDMVVATVNGIDITAWEVMQEFEIAADMLVMEYINLFPDDTEFHFDRPFRGTTFGRILLEEAANIAAHVKIYYDYAAQNDIVWGDMGFHHPVIETVFAIISNPALFAPFEQYMPEDENASSPYVILTQELRDRALAGEDFSELIQTYGEDPGMEDNPNGYTFVRGDMVTPFEEATLGLEIGEISGPVISNFGVHIIKRVAPDPDNIMHGSSAPPDVSEEDLLGAQHILITASLPTLEDRMFDAVFYAFEAKLEGANIQFLATLDDIPLE